MSKNSICQSTQDIFLKKKITQGIKTYNMSTKNCEKTKQYIKQLNIKNKNSNFKKYY